MHSLDFFTGGLDTRIKTACIALAALLALTAIPASCANRHRRQSLASVQDKSNARVRRSNGECHRHGNLGDAHLRHQCGRRIRSVAAYPGSL